MSSALQSGTVQRVFGAILFIPVVAAFFISKSAAQWIFLALALIMVWEFCVMHQMTRAVLLLRRFLENDINELNGENVKLRVIGSRDRLSSRLGSLIEWAEDETSGNTGLNLSIALDYGGRQELTNAARILATEVDRGIIKASDINEDILKSRMASSALPDIDLLIRTGGEQRLSNFMLWDMSYAELFFSPELWPDFSGESLDRALSSFAARDRRFGGNSKTDTGHPEEVATNVTRINAGSRQA